jgi:anaerobic selenocysteine-containing dehydrogenase
MPKQLACELMFGDDMAIPVPDIERCDYLLMLGANPIVSNGSLWMVPKFREKLRALQGRGGKLVTIDPRLSETARLADHHHSIRPGTDAWLLASIINQLTAMGHKISDQYAAVGEKALLNSLSRIDIVTTSEHTGISVSQIEEIAMQLSAANNAAVYGRIGTTLQTHGTLTSFLIEVVNLLIGGLDRPGGAMFPEQIYTTPSTKSSQPQHNRYQSRVSGVPEVLGQMPTSVLAEEIETPGEGQIRAMVIFAGNPLVSNQDTNRLTRAFESLDFLVSVDIYHNETTRISDVILPGTSPFEDGHYDHFLGSDGYRNSARYSPPLFNVVDRPDEWALGLSLAYATSYGKVPSAIELNDFEDDVIAGAVTGYTQDRESPLFERDVQELVSEIGPDRGVERLLDLGIRAGRWGDHFGTRDGITLKKLIDTPNGIDLGTPRSRISEVIATNDMKIELAPELILSDIETLKNSVSTTDLLLVGRRHVQTNNSWLHNLPMLTKAKRVCVLEINPKDATKRELAEGDWVRLSSATGTIEVEVMISNNIKEGVVSYPHGFSEITDIEQQITRSNKGANYNILASTENIDTLTATAALNGIPVQIEKLSIH